MWRNDKYIEPVKFAAGLERDAAEIVDAVGKDVTDFAAPPDRCRSSPAPATPNGEATPRR
jgi:hypothetical protein